MVIWVDADGNCARLERAVGAGATRHVLSAGRTINPLDVVFSPEEDRSYSASLKIDSKDRLELRAYVGVEAWGETLVWTRHRGGVERCGVGQ